MIDILLNTFRLFFAARFFRDNKAFALQWAIGFVLSGVLIGALTFVHPWLAVLVGGLLGGVLTPWLYKDLKYH